MPRCGWGSRMGISICIEGAFARWKVGTEDCKEIDAYNLVEMLTDALSEGENVDYQEVSFILGRLSSLQKPELIGIVLENLDRLWVVVGGHVMEAGVARQGAEERDAVANEHRDASDDETLNEARAQELLVGVIFFAARG